MRATRFRTPGNAAARMIRALFALFSWTVLPALVPAPGAAQSATPEIEVLRSRVGVMRANLPQITGVAEKFIPFLGHDTVARFLLPRRFDPAFSSEFTTRAGGPPDSRDTDGSDIAGLVLLPVRHWAGTGFGVAAVTERWQAMQRPVVVIGPANGRPAIVRSSASIDDGAPDGGREEASINGIANIIAAWTLDAEIVAAATRAGWQPGILLSVLDPAGSAHNDHALFRMAGQAPPPIVAAGRLGASYLDAIDSALAFAATPAHQTMVRAAADTLRALRAAGHKLFAASCGHYLAEEIPGDTAAAPFVPIDFRKNVATELLLHRAAPHDVIVWFGYGGYDCPNADVSGAFAHFRLDVVLITNTVPDPAPAEVVAAIPLSWRIPDAVVPIPFAPGHLAPISSVEMALHYLWLRRLVAAPGP